MNLPNFQRRRERERPVSFVPSAVVFKPQVQVQVLKDLNGWADREQRVKWHMPAGSIGCIDADKAREFSIKGYVMILGGEVRPASENEIAEILSTTTTINLGANNG